MTIYWDGVQIPSKPLQPDFANDRFIQSYLCLFMQTGQYYPDTENAISREQYKDACALFAFDLTPQMDSSEVGFEYFTRTVQGRLCLVRFRSHASDGFERGWIRIDKARQHESKFILLLLLHALVL